MLVVTLSNKHLNHNINVNDVRANGGPELSSPHNGRGPSVILQDMDQISAKRMRETEKKRMEKGV
jgi:hypothetical protein